MDKFTPTHETLGGDPVKAVRWNKDGDHPAVERYPIEKREYKGLLRAGKTKLALRFGDWIIEDRKGRFAAVSPERFAAGFRQLGVVSPSLSAIVSIIVLIAGLLFGDVGDLPLVIGFGVTHLMYYSILLAQWNGTANSVLDLDEAVDDIRVSAHTNTYAPVQDTHNFWDDTTNEVTGTNYTTGGAALANQLLSRSTNTVTFDADNVVWSQSGAGFSNARKFVIYRYNAVAGSAPLFSYVTADADVGNVTGDLTLAWNASGIATWTTT